MAYDKKTGIFNLTQSKASVWCRRPGRSNSIESCAVLLREAGLEVVTVQGNYLRVKATPGQVWEALSGQPSDPKREAHYLR